MDDTPAWMRQPQTAPADDTPKWMQQPATPQAAPQPDAPRWMREQQPKIAMKAPLAAQPPGPQDPSIIARTPAPQSWTDTVKHYGDQVLQKLKDPNLAADALGKVGEYGGRAVDAMLTPAGPLDPLHAIPNREKLVNDVKAYLFEGGNLAGPEGTPGLKRPEKPAEAPKVAEVPKPAAEPLKATGTDESIQLSTGGKGIPVSEGKTSYTIHRNELEGGKAVIYGVDSAEGKALANVTIEFRGFDNGKPTIAHVESIGGEGYVPIAGKTAQDARNKFGPKMLTQLRDQLQKDYPTVTKITGDRLSGARFGGKHIEGWRAGDPVEINLPARRPAAAGAQTTPLHELAAQNIRDFEAANPEPGFRQKLSDASTYAKQYFDTSGKAKAIIQKNVGNMQRMGAQAKDAMTKFGQFTRSMNPEEQISMLKWLQTPERMQAKGFVLPPEAEEFANTFKDWMQKYRQKLETLPQTDQMNFRENFVTQLWRNPKDAMAAINEYGAKKGSNYFTKARVFEDYEAGIRAGKAPLTTDPMELFSRYIENASAKIASWESKNDAKDAGLLVYRKLENAPEGWVPLKGERDAFGHDAYAPPGMAQIFNNYSSIAAQWKIPGTNFDVLSAAQRAANTTTAVKLSLSGFHAALESMESVLSGIADAITTLKNGRPIAGLTKLAKAPGKPFTSFQAGRRAQQAYLDGEFGSPEMQKIVQALTDANYDFMREGGLADEYRVSRLPGFIKGWQKGIPATAGGPLKMGIRAFETTMEPVFQYYVPWLKNQAAMDMMKTYLDAHPDLSAEDFAAYGRKVASIMDSRFGEMNTKNIFWPATAKKMAQTAAISWSFTLGQAKQALGAAFDAARIPEKAYRKAKGTLPDTEEIWTDRLSYAVAIGLGTALVNSVYQYLKTGQLPQTSQDLLNPRTGGTDPSTQQPERATLPNFANSYRNMWEGGVGQEAYNKMAPLWQTLIEAGPTLWGEAGKDWKGQPILDKNDTGVHQLEQLGEFVGSNLGTPITYGQVSQAKAGTKISGLERMFGIRAAGMRDTAPEQLGKIISYKTAEAWYDKRRSDINQKRAQNGLGPLRISHRQKTQLINEYMKHPEVDPLEKYGGTQ